MPDEAMKDETHQPTVEELKAKAYQPMEDAMKLHPFYRGKIETTLKCCVRDFDDFAIWYTPGVAAPCLDDPGGSRDGLRVHQQVEHRGRGQRRHARARHGRHRPQGRPARDGGQVPALQVPRRRRRLAAHGRHQGPGQAHRVRQAAAARARRHQPRGHRPAQVLPHPRHAARGVRDPRLARRPAGHRLRHARRPHQRPQGRGQAHRRDARSPSSAPAPPTSPSPG